MRAKNGFAILAGILLLALPAAAADEPKPGFFIGLEAKALQPSGTPTDFVLVDPDDDGNPEGSVAGVDFSNEVSPKLFLGWVNSQGGIWTLSWWNYDEDERTSVSSGTGELWDIIYHPDESFDSFTGTAAATAGVEATVIDLTYSRQVVQNDRFSLGWMGGIRSASFDFALDALYDDTFTQETLILVSEADGIGITGGLSGKCKLSDTWYVTGGAQYSLLTGDVDSRTVMFDNFGGIADPDANISAKRDRVLAMFDVQASIVWHPAEMWYFWAGYEFSQWTNAVDTTLFADDVNEGFTQSRSSDVTWDGFKIGAGIKF